MYTHDGNRLLAIALRSLLAMHLLLGISTGLSHAEAGSNMIGRQSQNEGIPVLPKPGKVVVDGDLADWDLSGRIWVFADTSVRDRFSVKVSAMWDTEHLYLSARFKDPTPMVNNFDPNFNPNEGWKADCWQIRLLTDQTVHLTTWYATPIKQPTMHVNFSGSGVGGKTMVLFKGVGPNVGEGVQMAYTKDADGQGFAQEMRIPWKLIYKSAPSVGPDHKFLMGNEFLWGDPTGKNKPIHRYADNMKVGVTSREFYWSNTKAWGEAKLSAIGNVKKRTYFAKGSRIEGVIPITLEVPADATRLTIAINDESGQRIRNLAADIDPREYSKGEPAITRTVAVKWDGLDDQGKLVSPGNYTARGLTHRGLSADYDSTFYNPGTPAWATPDGTGAWGADHGDPRYVARAGNKMLIGWGGVEGGYGVIGVNTEGKRANLKAWGEKRGARSLAGDDTYVFATTTSAYSSGALCRFATKDGAATPFVLDGKKRPFELSMSEIFGSASPLAKTKVIALAVHAKVGLALIFENGNLAILDRHTARPLQHFSIPTVTAAAFSTDGALYLANTTTVYAVDIAAKKTKPVSLAVKGNVMDIADMAIDGENNIIVADKGVDSQVKIFSAAGEYLRSCGKKGGRPLRGKFDPQAMMRLASVDVDKLGNIWVVERWKNPRRVSVWHPTTGKLVCDYVGNSAYAGTGSYLDEDDPSLGFVGSIKMTLDRQKGSYEVTDILWVPDRSKNEGFSLWVHAHWFSNPSFVTSSASGKQIKYLYSNGMYARWHAIFMKRGDAYQPVSAIGDVKEMQKEFPNLKWNIPAGTKSIFWNDSNGDAAVQLIECSFSTTVPYGRAGWGAKPGADLNIYMDNGRFGPTKFLADGTPIFTEEGFKPHSNKLNVAIVPLVEKNMMLTMGGSVTHGGLLKGVSMDGKTLWQYPNPYPGVHGSHRATMPKAGLIIGTIKICGIAEVNDKVGHVFLIRGNLGQDFIFTTDGFYVGAMFQDGRLPGMSLPSTESALKGMPMEAFSNGGEPFSGWFGKHSDGKIRLTNGFARQAAMILEINGLDSIQRYKPIPITVSPDDIQLALAFKEQKAKAGNVAKAYAIAKRSSAPRIDGDLKDWAGTASLVVEREGSPVKATAHMVYDETYLHIAMSVEDASPWMNSGTDHTRLFKTGDAVDIQFSSKLFTGKGQAGKDVATHHARVVMANFKKRPVSVLMRPVDKTAAANMKVTYTTGWSKTFDRVELVQSNIKVKKTGRGYVIEAALPLTSLGLFPKAGMSIRGDVGFISSDSAGRINTARTYWSNKQTNLVNDTPLEAWLTPNMWGTLTFK